MGVESFEISGGGGEGEELCLTKSAIERFRIMPSHFRSYQQLFSYPQQLSLIRVSRHSVFFLYAAIL